MLNNMLSSELYHGIINMHGSENSYNTQMFKPLAAPCHLSS